MPVFVNEENVIERITFDKPVAEKPLKNGYFARFMRHVWHMIYGG